MFNEKSLLIFTRFPEGGKVKSRLIPMLGADGAALLQKRMTEYVVAVLSAFSNASDASLAILHDGGNKAAMARWLGDDFLYIPQEGKDLGVRLSQAFQIARKGGAERTVIVGSDCPFIDEDILIHAFNLLKHKDLVLGPAADGGYYLIGLRAYFPALFQDIAWGTERVFKQTVAAAERIGISLAFLNVLPDVDRPEDLSLLPPSLAIP